MAVCLAQNIVCHKSCSNFVKVDAGFRSGEAASCGRERLVGVRGCGRRWADVDRCAGVEGRVSGRAAAREISERVSRREEAVCSREAAGRVARLAAALPERIKIPYNINPLYVVVNIFPLTEFF